MDWGYRDGDCGHEVAVEILEVVVKESENYVGFGIF
jgi:hypothetical protein